MGKCFFKYFFRSANERRSILIFVPMPFLMQSATSFYFLLFFIYIIQEH